jgi:hypothetical protein
VYVKEDLSSVHVVCRRLTTSLYTDPSLRSGWGDEEAEEILYGKLAAAYCPSNLHRHLSLLGEELVALQEKLSSVTQSGHASAPWETAQPVGNVQHCQANQAQVLNSGEPILQRSHVKPQCIDINSGNPREALKSTRPVFGLPSTPSRRIVSSFDISSSPFAVYSHESSPFVQLTQRKGSASGVFEAPPLPSLPGI